jgi:hypothetical protein
MPATRLLRIPLAALCVGLFACGGEDMAMDTALAVPKEGWQPYPPTAGPPPGWTGPVFELSLDFPSEPPDDTPPFLSIDFQTTGRRTGGRYGRISMRGTSTVE